MVPTLIGQALDSVLQGILIVDRALAIVLANRQYLEMFEVDPAFAAPGRPLDALLHHLAERGEFGPGDAAAQVEERMAPIRAGEHWVQDRRRRNGTHLFITGHDLAGGGYVLTFTDVTAHMQAVYRLEQAVANRTREYRVAKETAEAAHRLIDQSLSYASRIQASMLPDLAAHGGLLAEVAALWQPVQPVGGDLYWIGRDGDRCVVAVMDCTGHGVPGAFMAAAARATLDSVLRQSGYGDPARILAEMNRLVRQTLRQEQPGPGSDDGLDAAICVVEPRAGRLRYAGARVPLVVQGPSAATLIRPDRHSLGYRRSRPDFPFTTHELPLVPGTAFYLYTDGLTDQFGGSPRQLFGPRRLLDALRSLDGPMAERVAEIGARLEAWRGPEARVDDLTLVGFTAVPA